MKPWNTDLKNANYVGVCTWGSTISLEEASSGIKLTALGSVWIHSWIVIFSLGINKSNSASLLSNCWILSLPSSLALATLEAYRGKKQNVNKDQNKNLNCKILTRYANL